jgi:hypothetical protein
MPFTSTTSLKLDTEMHVESRWIIHEDSLTPYAFSYRI